MSIARRILLASVVLSLLVERRVRDAHPRDQRSAQGERARGPRERRHDGDARLEKLVVDLETGLRGLVLTGNERFLAALDGRAAPAAAARAECRAAGGGGTRCRSAAPARLATLISAYVRDYLEPLVSIARVDRRARERPIATREGKRRTDEIRGLFTRFLAAETDERAAASTRAPNERSTWAIRAGAAGVIVSVALIVLFGIYLARSIGRPVRDVASGASELAGGRPVAAAPPRTGRARWAS